MYPVSLAVMLVIASGVILSIFGLLQLFSNSYATWRINLLSKIVGRKLSISKKGNTLGGVILLLAGLFALYQGYLLLEKLSSL